VSLTLRRSKPQFSLCSPDEASKTRFPYKIVLEEAIWMIKRHSIHPQVLAEHQNLLNTRRFNFPFVNNEVRSFLIQSGSLSVISETIFSGIIPSFCVIGLVSSTAFNGDIKSNPFGFKPYQLAAITLTCDGQSVLFRQINFDIDNGIYLQRYNTLISLLPHKELGSIITRENYTINRFLIALDLVPSHNSNRFYISKHGQIKVELRFKSATTESLMCIILGSFQNNIQIDRDRNIFSDAIIV
jgi:hypothetical protein